jgi:hypothetical protein
MALEMDTQTDALGTEGRGGKGHREVEGYRERPGGLIAN